jgi:hypothetical protein
MQNTINTVAEKFLQSEVGKEVLNDFLRMRKDTGWRFMQTFIVELGNHLANEVLSRRFQTIPDDQKLIRLAAYSDISVLLKFLASPSSTFERMANIREHNKQMGKLRPKARQDRQPE